MKMEISFPGGMKVNAQFEHHLIKTDQTKKEGGEETAPEPLTYFIASIGTCAGVYILHFCKKRNLPMKYIRIITETEKDTDTHLIKKIMITIHLPSDFPQQYEKAVIRAADQCTVKKLLVTPPEITITALKQP